VKIDGNNTKSAMLASMFEPSVEYGNKEDIRFRTSEKLNEEEQAIIERAKADGTYMKAPNGEPTKLTEKQWVQVRTKAFKQWFGDWEKAARVEKLRRSETVAIKGDEYEGKYELNRDSAKQWIKDNLRKEYTNEDTGEKISLSKVSANEVTSHGERDEAHLKSVVAIPQLIEKSIFIEEQPNEKGNDKYDSYRYYVCGLKIGGEDYTVKIVIGVKNGSKYYDHRLTQIEKGKLINSLNGLSNSVAANQNAPISVGKDTKLHALLQTNSSKVVDENGEPLVVYHGTPNEFNTFNIQKAGENTAAIMSHMGFFFTPHEEYAKQISHGGKVMPVFLNLKSDLELGLFPTAEHIESNTRGEGKRFLTYSNGMDGKPMDATLAGHGRDGLQTIKDAIVKKYGDYNAETTEAYREFLKSIGIDGIKVITSDTYTFLRDFVPRAQFIVFSPNQIKSATDNNGEFSQSDDDIRFRKEGEQSEAAHTPRTITSESEALAGKLGVRMRVITNRNDIKDSDKMRERRKRNAKGWFDAATGEVVLGMDQISHFGKRDYLRF